MDTYEIGYLSTPCWDVGMYVVGGGLKKDVF